VRLGARPSRRCCRARAAAECRAAVPTPPSSPASLPRPPAARPLRSLRNLVGTAGDGLSKPSQGFAARDDSAATVRREIPKTPTRLPPQPVPVRPRRPPTALDVPPAPPRQRHHRQGSALRGASGPSRTSLAFRPPPLLAASSPRRRPPAARRPMRSVPRSPPEGFRNPPAVSASWRAGRGRPTSGRSAGTLVVRPAPGTEGSPGLTMPGMNQIRASLGIENRFLSATRPAPLTDLGGVSKPLRGFRGVPSPARDRNRYSVARSRRPPTTFKRQAGDPGPIPIRPRSDPESTPIPAQPPEHLPRAFDRDRYLCLSCFPRMPHERPRFARAAAARRNGAKCRGPASPERRPRTQDRHAPGGAVRGRDGLRGAGACPARAVRSARRLQGEPRAPSRRGRLVSATPPASSSRSSIAANISTTTAATRLASP
jgi:hypothetical protein